MLTGDKGKDGEAVGYACRLSDKLPEDCMKENSTYTPASILDGWKRADKDKKEALQPGPNPPEGGAPAEGEAKPEDEAKPEGEQTAPENAAPAAEQPAKH